MSAKEDIIDKFSRRFIVYMLWMVVWISVMVVLEHAGNRVVFVVVAGCGGMVRFRVYMWLTEWLWVKS